MRPQGSPSQKTPSDFSSAESLAPPLKRVVILSFFVAIRDATSRVALSENSFGLFFGRVSGTMYFIVQFARNYFLSLRGRKPKAIQFLPTLNGRKFTNPYWTKTDFYWTLFSIFIHPSPEFRPHPLAMGKGNKSLIWGF